MALSVRPSKDVVLQREGERGGGAKQRSSRLHVALVGRLALPPGESREGTTWTLPHGQAPVFVPAATKQHPPLIFHSSSYVHAASLPEATPIVTHLFMSPPPTHPRRLPANSPNLAPSEALDSSKWGLPLSSRTATRAPPQPDEGEMSLCDLGYYSAL